MRYEPKHNYPPMLGPMEDVPTGTSEWAERLGLRLLLRVEKIETLGARAVEDIIVAVGAALRFSRGRFGRTHRA